MRKITTLLTILLCTVTFNTALAKKSTKSKKKKAEMAVMKEWKKKKNTMTPLQLKALVEENSQLKEQNKKLEKELKKAKSSLQDPKEQSKQAAERSEVHAGEEVSEDDAPQEGQKKRSMFTKRSKKSRAYKGKKKGQKKKPTHQGEQKNVSPEGISESDWGIGANGKPYIRGIVFKVQIGAYRKRDLSNVLEGDKPQEAFTQERVGDVNMYTFKHFRDYWKADQFKKELRAMGLKDAWIVVFKDGQRVQLKEVLSEITPKRY